MFSYKLIYKHRRVDASFFKTESWQEVYKMRDTIVYVYIISNVYMYILYIYTFEIIYTYDTIVYVYIFSNVYIYIFFQICIKIHTCNACVYMYAYGFLLYVHVYLHTCIYMTSISIYKPHSFCIRPRMEISHFKRHELVDCPLFSIAR